MEILPDNWRAVEFFLFCATQWHTDQGVRTGLDYSAVTAVLHAFRISHRQHARLMAEIQLIERGALTSLREQAEATNGT
jgi:hypothetical protein